MNHGFAAEILNFGSFAAVLALLVWHFNTHRSYVRLIFETWIVLIPWALLNCFLFPLLFVRFGYKDAFDYFPDMRGVLAVGFLGWLAGLQLAAVIFLVRLAWNAATRLLQRFAKHPKTAK